MINTSETLFQQGLNPEDIPLALERLLPTKKIKNIANESGFIKRDRKIDPVAFLWTLVLGFGVNIERNLSTLKRCYENQTECHLSDGSWYERFTPKMVKFLKSNVQLALANLANDECHELSYKLKKFEDIFIQDSTVIRLNAILAKKWPATRARKAAAGVKVSALISVVANGPKSVTIHGERTSELKTLHIGPWVKNCILLMDLGFFKYQLFARIDENEGFFVSRLKNNADPFIRSTLKVHRGQAIDIAGKRWSEVKDMLLRDVLDAEVEVAFSRRQYAGKHSRDTMVMRMIAIYNKDDKQYHTYITNIPPEVLEPEDVAELYRVRWAIELVFKELKGRYALDAINTTKTYIVEGLIWTAILTLVVSRQLYNLLLESSPPDKRRRYTPLRWANTFVENGSTLLVALMGYYGLAPPYPKGFESVARMYEHQALDPHVKRRRLPDGWWS